MPRCASRRRTSNHRRHLSNETRAAAKNTRNEKPVSPTCSRTARQTPGLPGKVLPGVGAETRWPAAPISEQTLGATPRTQVRRVRFIGRGQRGTSPVSSSSLFAPSIILASRRPSAQPPPEKTYAPISLLTKRLISGEFLIRPQMPRASFARGRKAARLPRRRCAVLRVHSTRGANFNVLRLSLGVSSAQSSFVHRLLRAFIAERRAKRALLNR